MRRDLALAAYVERKGDVAGLGQLCAPGARVLVVAPPLVDDQHAGALSRRRVVPGQQALEWRAVLRVVHDARLTAAEAVLVRPAVNTTAAKIV
jgi:hypothetical protein